MSTAGWSGLVVGLTFIASLYLLGWLGHKYSDRLVKWMDRRWYYAVTGLLFSVPTFVVVIFGPSIIVAMLLDRVLK